MKSVLEIKEGWVTIHPVEGNVWLTQHQIADIFGVFVSTVGSNIRSILKTEVLREEDVCRNQKTENGSVMTLYNMEMITALAFRLKSYQAQQFREWIIRQVVNPVTHWAISGSANILN